MPNPESFNSHSEDTGENLNSTYAERGEKALAAAREAEIQRQLAKRIAEGKAYEQKLAELRARAEAKRAEIVRLEAEEAAEASGTNPPKPPVPPETSGTSPAADPNAGGSSVPSGEASPSNPEVKPSAAEIKNTVNKAKKHNGFKTFAAGLLVLALGTAAFFGVKTNGFGLFGNNDQRQQPAENPTAITEPVSIELQESEKGIKDGYGEKGLWLSEHKDHDYDYGDAREVAEVCKNDDVEMLKYTGENQVESLADYIERMPKGLCPEGYEDLSVREIEAKLESLTPDEYEAVKAKAMHALDEAFTRRTVTDRNYHHYGMLLEDPSGKVIHENMQLVDRGIGPGVEVVEFYWEATDSHEAGSMLVNITPVYDNDGNITGYTGGLEVLRPGETSPTDPSSPEDPTDPESPEDPEEPEDPEDPSAPLTPKDEDEEREHAGPRVTPLELDEEVTPPTTLEQDQEGFSAIEEQRREDEQAAAEAEKVKAEQAEAERKAAEEAAARRRAEAEEAARLTEAERAAEAERQRQADEAARRAEAEAAEAQRQAAEAEQQRQTDEAARIAAQEQADREAAAAAAEAAETAGASAGERADIFESGDF